MKKGFEIMFKEWFQLVAYKDPQHYQDLDWDWEEEIEKFIEDPQNELSYQLAAKQEDDETLNEEMQKDMENIKE